MGIICPGEVTLMAPGTLKTCPDVGLDIFQHMTQVDRAVCIGQGAGNEDSSFLFAHGVCYQLILFSGTASRSRGPGFGRLRNYGTLASQAVAPGGHRLVQRLSGRATTDEFDS